MHIFNYFSKGIPSQMSTGGGLVVNNGPNVVCERPLWSAVCHRPTTTCTLCCNISDIYYQFIVCWLWGFKLYHARNGKHEICCMGLNINLIITSRSLAYIHTFWYLKININLTNRRGWGRLSPSTSWWNQQRPCKDIGQNFITILQLLTLSFETL